MDSVKKVFIVCIYIIVVAIILSFLLIGYLSNKIYPALNKYLNNEGRRFVSIVVNKSVNDIVSGIDSDDIIKKDGNGEYIIDNGYLNSLNVLINKNINNNLRLLELGDIDKISIDSSDVSLIEYEKINGGLIYYFPVGNLKGGFLINNIFPNIPIKFSFVGSNISKVNSNIREYGINNAIYDVFVDINVSIGISIPFVSDSIIVRDRIPIVTKIINGSIPSYYYGNGYR